MMIDHPMLETWKKESDMETVFNWLDMEYGTRVLGNRIDVMAMASPLEVIGHSCLVYTRVANRLACILLGVRILTQFLSATSLKTNELTSLLVLE
jgi:hypothetical protein